MADINQIFDDAVEEWKNNHGVGTCLIPPPLNDKIMVYNILTKMYSKNPQCKILIVTNTFKDRMDIIDFITNQDEENDKEFKQLINDKTLKIFSYSLAKDYNQLLDLVIIYNPDEITNYIFGLLRKAHFQLVIFSKLLNDYNQLQDLYKVCPLLSAFKQKEVEAIRLSTPVEEEWIKVELPTDSQDYKDYQKYTEYIQTSLNIFGSFNNMQQARMGNSALNISASSICLQIATENGWNDSLDMSIQYNRDIDELYNPNSLRERASRTYDMIRNRNILIADYEPKLEKVIELINKHKGEKILVINKRGEFANKVTEYVNSMSETIICANYHDKVEDIPAVDINGNAIYVKSGKAKGERKMMGVQAQKTLNEQLFNLGKINVLSLSNSPDKKLTVDVDVIIITSPLCEDIETYMYRLSNVVYKDKIKLYSIFCKNTIEESKLFNKSLSETHTIVNKCEIDNNGQNNFDFMIDD